MGLFNRFGNIVGGKATKADTYAKNPSDLIDQGNALEDEGFLDKALMLYEEAVRLEPNLARAYLNRGNIRLAKDNVEGAMADYATALVHDSQYAAARYNMGNGFLRLGQREAALAEYVKAIEIRHDFVDAEVARANILNEMGRLDAAVASYRRVLQFNPDHAEIHYWLGSVLRQLTRLDDAEHCYRRAGELKPEFFQAQSSLGSLLHDRGQLHEAAVSYRRALDIRSDLLEVHGNLGNVLKDLGQFDDAVASYRRVLEIQPDSAEAYSNLGLVLKDLGRLDDAVTSYLRALELDPEFADAHVNLGVVLKALGKLDLAEESLRRALRINPDYIEVYSNLLFLQHYRVNQLAPALLAEARDYGERVTRRSRPYTVWSNNPEPARRLRVGFLSGDFRDHPVGHFIEAVFSVLKSRAADRVEICAYTNHSLCDEITERIKASCHAWHSAVGLSDESLAQRIRDDSIDILIDLSGHTAYNRLPVFAWKPAPIQITWLGYLATTGVKEIDYLLADAWTLQETEDIYFSEKVWRLPECYLCFTPPRSGPEAGPLPAMGVGHITFGSFNNLTKMNDDVVALWAQVVTAVPDSRLFLKSSQFKEPSVQESVVERFARHGVASSRLILEGPVPRAAYLAPFQRVDIALDPFPYPGITTSVESLWMGVPVLTLSGQSFLSRQGVGLMMNAGLPDWIATDAEDYVAKAVSHAGNLPKLAALRMKLRQQVLASPIFDASRFACHFEAALRGMWQTWCAQQHSSSQEHKSSMQTPGGHRNGLV